MYQYDCEKPRSYRSDHARRPLPPRPDCHNVPVKHSVPLKVWIIASASCFAVCAALVLATVVITKWGTVDYPTHEVYGEIPESIYANTASQAANPEPIEDIDNDIKIPVLEKLPIFKNIVADRDRKKIDDNLASKPQLHPIHDTTLHHTERKIEKKDHALLPEHGITKTKAFNANPVIDERKIPEFKPTLPDIFKDVKDGYIPGIRKHDDFYDYYNDENLYDDYMESNTMTNYLIEKIQELHDWITSDPDFDAVNSTKKNKSGNDFSQLLKALNESLIEGNVTIIMSKLKDIYFGENLTNSNHSRKVILTNSTDLLSFGILTLDVMLLHNIQQMAWESQETAKLKMLKDPDVFAFNALFLEPGKVEPLRNEIYNHYDSQYAKRQNLRQDADVFDFGKNLLENVLEVGMSTARAAIHLGRAYKNTRNVLNQLSNRDTVNNNIQNQLSRSIDGNAHALNHLQSSYNRSEGSDVYTDLDCIWILYCRNLVATAKLNAPYGTMARINGMALRMLAGELSADRALHSALHEALAGWTELRCNDMFPRCSKVNAASIVLESILQPLRKSQTNKPLV
ncbi:uncharacterized protein [Epargyreus clarus]|uniref:uncharacterized protein n=1 Tax=Epargyreus clarus TaxID=520877 RepID=UPI003C2CC32F